MSGSKKSKPIKAKPYLSFESPTDYIVDNKHHFNYNGSSRINSQCTLTMELMSSPAYLDLTPRQKVLYSYAKLQYYGAVDKVCSRYPEFQNAHAKEYFYLNSNLLRNVYHLYNSNTTMYKDLDELVKHGFIVKVQTENHQRTIYRYSAEWINWQPGMIYEGVRKYKDTDQGRIEVFEQYEWKRISYN